MSRIASVTGAALIALSPLNVWASSPPTEAAVAAFSQGSAPAIGVADAQTPNLARSGKITYNLPPVSNKSIWANEQMSTIVGTKRLSEPSLRINGITYLPLRAVASAIGARVNYDSSTRTMTVSGWHLTFTATDGNYTSYANGRPLFAFSPNVIMSNGRMYVPASVIGRAFGMAADTEGSEVGLKGQYNPIGAPYYTEDEVFWLARIITAEAGGESLLGQIAVGDVILNRVRSAAFPNTIYGVIFDRRYGVQFSPVANGTIYNTPTYTARLAAKICLEGTSLSDNAMYFHNPRTAHSHWIEQNRKYLYTIGGHDFYL